MKRLISVLLALALCISVLGGVSFAGAEDTAAERTYTLNNTVLDKTDPDIWDNTLTAGTLQDSIVPVIGFGTHGYKYWTADTATYNAAPTVRVLQMTDARFRMYGNYDGKALLENKDGLRLAIALEKPCAVPSFYKVIINRYSKGKGYMVWTRPLVETNRDITYYQADAAQNGTTYTFTDSLTTISELIWNNGTDDHVISFYTGRDEANDYGQRIELYGLTLSPVDATSIKLTFDKAYLLTGETKNIRTYANLADKSQVFITDSYVTYKSSDDEIASVAADGTITAHKAGTATITATVGSFSSSATVNVGKHNYSFAKPTMAAADWDSTLTAKNVQSSIVPLLGFGTHGYKYWDADDASVGYQSTNVRALHYYTGGLRVWSYGDNSEAETFNNPNGAKLALVYKTPRKGFYSLSHTKGSSDGGCKNLEVYMQPITAEEEAVAERPQAETYIKPESLVKSGMEGSIGSYAYNKIVALDGTNNFIWTVSVDPESRFSMMDFTLTELDVTAIDLASSATELEIDGTAALTASANGNPIAHSFVKYETEDTDVVSIAADGTVTALAAGEAEIRATANGLSDTVTITVAEPAAAPGEEVADPTVNFTALAETGGTVTDQDKIKNVAIGSSVTVEATADEGYEFAYWRNASGKHLSSSAKETFKVNTNTSVIAVFDKATVSEDDTTVPVYFYNENGSLIEKKNVEKGNTFGVAKSGVKTSLTGHIFDKWSIADNTVVDKLLRAVALYNKDETKYKVTVGGEEVASGAYGDTVTVKGGDSFKCWKLGNNVASYDKEYSFLIWGDITLTEVTEGEVKSEPTVAINRNGDNYFIAYNVPTGYTLIEAGIVFAKSGEPTIGSFHSKAVAKTGSGQFTSKSGDGTENVARGYVMFKDAEGSIRVIYAK